MIVLRWSPDWGLLERRYREDPERFDWDFPRTAGFGQAEGDPGEFRVRSDIRRQAIELWNSTFETSFFAMREAIQILTLDALGAVEGTRLVSPDLYTLDRLPDRELRPDEMRLFEDLDRDGENVPDLALLTDDDDWYAPDIVERLLPAAAGHDGLTWTSVVYDGVLTRRDALADFCFTNNYAVTARLISSGSCTLTGTTSTPKDEATD